MRTVSRAGVPAVVVSAALVLVGCSGSGAAPASPVSSAPPPAASSSQSPVLLVDVRTAEEFAEGHLDGAVNVPVQTPGFADEVAALAQGRPVEVYCRSGNRSAQAVALLDGFEVADLGGYEQAAAVTGRSTVR